MNNFNDFFINLGPTLASKIKKPSHKSFKNYLNKKHETIFRFQNVTEDYVRKIISDLCTKDSYGHDGISTKLLKYISNKNCKPQTLVVNQCLQTGIFPDNMKLAKVIPIYKKGDSSNMSNYRPISKLPSISKIIERIVFNQLNTYFHKHKLLNTNQYGFRSKHSTELAALHVVDEVINDLDRNSVPLNIYLDLSKAFDTLDHTILLSKLHYYGISNLELNFFKNYLFNRHQYVQMGTTKSTLKNIKTGVPQGSILGPLLFIIYINDIPCASNFLKIITYADDTTLMCSLNSQDLRNPEELSNIINLELDKISEWLKLNRLSLNIAKSKFVMFHMPQKKIPDLLLKIENVALERVKTFNFLGITLHEHLKWDTHINCISNKISCVIGTMNRLKHFIPPNILLTLYNSLILPHSYYGILIWGHSNTDQIIKLQKKAVRIISGSAHNAHSEPLFKILRLLKLQDIHAHYNNINLFIN